MLVAPHPAVTDEQIIEFCAGHRGEGSPQWGQTNAGAEQVEVVDHRVAAARAGPMGRAANESDRISGRAAGVPPLPEGAGRDVQQVGNLGSGITDSGDVRGYGNSVPAHEFLSAVISQPSREPAAPGRRRHRLGIA
jgi:hypothetical protein